MPKQRPPSMMGVITPEAPNPTTLEVSPDTGQILAEQYSLRWDAATDRVSLLRRKSGGVVAEEERLVTMEWEAFRFLATGLSSGSGDEATAAGGHPYALPFLEAVISMKTAIVQAAIPMDFKHLVLNRLQEGLPVNSTIQESVPPSVEPTKNCQPSPLIFKRP
jgi:hypothetical protein